MQIFLESEYHSLTRGIRFLTESQRVWDYVLYADGPRILLRFPSEPYQNLNPDISHGITNL